MDESSSIATQYNGVYATPTNQAEDANPDLFTQVLRYDNPVAAIGTTTPQYNGNIAQIQWQVAGREAQAYTYTYDKLDRLTNAEYTDIHEGSWWSNAYDKNNRYQESLSYDDRGNIMTLNRRGQTQKGFVATNTALMGGNHGTIDNLTYTYNDKNQVTKIMDAATLTEGFKSKNNANTGQYSYDANGNMTADINKEITNIEYNYLNLPVVISFTNSRKIEFTYDATGKKWRKVVTNGSSISIRDYIDGAEYESVNNAPSEPKIIHHTEGYIEYDATQLNTTWKGWVYHYTLKDHLGNTRVTFSDANDDGYVNTSTDVKQVNNYYPFGLNMEGNWNGAMGAFKYQYNGKELNEDFGLNWNDYGARFYDAAVGRFAKIDNFSEKYSNLSNYTYAANSPVQYIDVNGDSLYLMFYITGHSHGGDDMFRAAAETRKLDIENSGSFDSKRDKVIVESFSDVSQIKGKVESAVAANKGNYGTTVEVGVWSHCGLNGPVGGQPASSNPLSCNNGVCSSQMALEGWGKIDFNWSQNSRANFFGCNSGNSKSGESFTTGLSRLNNFKDVNVAGQPTYAYPSKYVNSRSLTMSQAMNSYLPVVSSVHINGEVGPGATAINIHRTYMVAGEREKSLNSFFGGTKANPMTVSKNGVIITTQQYQPGQTK
jgi:RHS repeat-associated protein